MQRWATEFLGEHLLEFMKERPEFLELPNQNQNMKEDS